MKKVMSTRAALAFIAICLGIISCDDFLDVKVQAGVTQDPNLPEKLVTGVYSSLLQGDSWGSGDTHGFAYLTVIQWKVCIG